MEAAPLIAQAGTIPFRRTGDAVEYCLITSTRTRKWGFPKGIIDPGETPEQAALKESLEEAGLCGRIVGEPLGSYRYQKWNAELSVTMFLMDVERVEADWLESGLRERRWETYGTASELLCRESLRLLLTEAQRRVGDVGRLS